VTDHYTATLEGFIARFDDVITKLRETVNAADLDEVVDLLDELVEELERANEFIEQKRKRGSEAAN
jgi:hypothetical protein